MANILIVSGSYFPYATANAVCVKKFEDVLKAKGHRVIYCNRKHDLYEPDYHTYEGTELYTIGKNSDIFFQTMDRLCNLDMPNGMQSCAKASYYFFRVLMKLKNFSRNSGNLRKSAISHYLDRYSDKIASLVETDKIDMIISVSMPFMSHLAVLQAMRKLDKKNVSRPKWVVYSIDAYWSKSGINPRDIPAMKVKEFDIFNECDEVLFLDSIAGDYMSTEYDKIRSKISALPLPTFELNKISDKLSQSKDLTSNIQFLYAGTIYDGFRNLDGLVDVINKLKNAPFEFHFMGKIYPIAYHRLSELANKYNHRIYIHGIVPYTEALRAIRNSDILINLSNDSENQIPSKVYEYITNKKPILNIYSNPKDVGTKYLKMYPLSYNYFYHPFMRDETEKLIQWIQNARDMSVSNEELSIIYKDIISENVTRSFSQSIENILAMNQ